MSMNGKKVLNTKTGEPGYVRHVELYQGHPSPTEDDYVPAAFYLLVVTKSGNLTTWPAHVCQEVNS